MNPSPTYKSQEIVYANKIAIVPYRPGKVDSQFIVTACMLLITPARNFVIGISDRNTLIKQSLFSNRAISYTLTEKLNDNEM